MKVAIFGAGCVGCVTAACLAKLDHQVWLVEVVPEKLQALADGRSPVAEPGLESELVKQMAARRLITTGSGELAVAETDLALICVGTPSRGDGLPDLSQVGRVCGEIGEALRNRDGAYTVVLRSTAPFPLVTEGPLRELITRVGEQWGRDVTFAINPEFLRESSAIRDFFEPPLIVIGTEHSAAADRLKEMYRPISAPLHIVAPGTASLLKYACNAFHAVKVVFANEVQAVAAAFGADAQQVMALFCDDRTLNISPAYLRPGFAYGGSCLPKDLRAVTRLAQVAGITAPMLEAVPVSNAGVIERAVETIVTHGSRRVALIGLSFKVGTDDLRESPLVKLAEGVIGRGCELRIYDPDVQPEKLLGRNLAHSRKRLGHLSVLLCREPAVALGEAELIVVGKNFAGVAELLAQATAEAVVLDLTGQCRETGGRRLMTMG